MIQELDTDGSGTLSKAELLRDLAPGESAAEIEEAFKLADSNDDGQVDADELGKLFESMDILSALDEAGIGQEVPTEDAIQAIRAATDEARETLREALSGEKSDEAQRQTASLFETLLDANKKEDRSRASEPGACWITASRAQGT